MIGEISSSDFSNIRLYNSEIVVTVAIKFQNEKIQSVWDSHLYSIKY